MKEFGQQIREEGPQEHHAKAGTPTMGGLIIFLAIAIPYLVLSDRDTAEPGRVRGRARLRRARLRRRLHQDHQAPLARPRGALQAAGPDRPRGRPLVRGDRGRRARPGARARASSTPRSTSARSLYLVFVFLVDRRRLERRQPHRRPRRARGGLLRDRAARLHGDHDHHRAGGPGAALGLPRRRLRSASSGSTPSRPRSSWATPARWASGAAIGALAVMTQTELLLIILGGIFVIEALSVAIQVATFKLFRRRVLLMAPVHHHFEMLAWSETKIMLRFWIIAAVCSGIGYVLFQNSDSGAGRLERGGGPPLRGRGRPLVSETPSYGTSAEDPSRARPLPEGPYLVVGLARSGQAAARLLAERGEEVIGVDSGSPGGRGRAGGRGRRSQPGWRRNRPARRGRAAWSRAPACPARRPSSRPPASGGCRSSASSSSPGGCCRTASSRSPAPTARRPSTELLGEIWRAGRDGRSRSPATSARRWRRWSARVSDDATVVCECLELPARGRRGLRARVRGAAQPRAPTTSTATARSRHYLDAKLRIFANQGNDDFAVYNGATRRCAAATSAAARAGSPSAATARGRRLRGRPSTARRSSPAASR